ncbi:MAG: hypothetical protein ACE5HX_00855 [bacterium]
MKKVMILILFLYPYMKIEAQVLAFKTHFVKKSGQITAQLDTLNGRDTFGKHVSGGGNVRNGTLADTLFYLTGTGKDTSRVYKLLAGNATFHIELDDTSAADDSAGVTLKIYAAPKNQFDTAIPAFSRFVFVDSIDVKPGASFTGLYFDPAYPTSGVNGQGSASWTYTTAGSNRPGYEYYFITLNGITNVNKLASAVKVLVTAKFPYLTK